MTLIVADRVKETSETTGTGPFALAGAMMGYRAFSSVCAAGDTCYYAAQAVNSSGAATGEWEVGLGTIGTGNTLSRTTVLASSATSFAVAPGVFNAGTGMTSLAGNGLSAETGWAFESTVQGVPNGYAERTLTVNAACILSGSYAVDSEGGFDKIRIVVNGSEVFQDSGLAKSGTFQYTLAANSTVSFRYTKDGVSDAGSDKAAWSGIYLLPAPGAAAIPVSFAAGTKQVWLDLAAKQLADLSAAVSGIPASGSGASAGLVDSVPQLSDFAWVNQSNAAATQETFGISMGTPAMVGDSLHCLVRPIPAGSHSVVMRSKAFLSSRNYTTSGLCLYDSQSGRVQTLSPGFRDGLKLIGINWNSPTSYNGDIGAATAVQIEQWPEWMRLSDDGSNRVFAVSADGKTWVNVFTYSRTEFLTPTHVGFYVNPNSAYSVGSSLTVFSWTQG